LALTYTCYYKSTKIESRESKSFCLRGLRSGITSMLIINAAGRILAAPNPYSCFDKYQNTWITCWPRYTRIHQPKYSRRRASCSAALAPDFSLHSESCPVHLSSSSSSEQDPISARQSRDRVRLRAQVDFAVNKFYILSQVSVIKLVIFSLNVVLDYKNMVR